MDIVSLVGKILSYIELHYKLAGWVLYVPAAQWTGPLWEESLVSKEHPEERRRSKLSTVPDIAHVWRGVQPSPSY